MNNVAKIREEERDSMGECSTYISGDLLMNNQ